jgi:hypothetical protein
MPSFSSYRETSIGSNVAFSKASMFAFAVASLFLFQCINKKADFQTLQSQVSDTEKIAGKSIYLDTPFITAGDRVYMVGHQNGTFPDLGWHVTGEMGGV